MKTIVEHLDEAGVDWRAYSHDIAFLRVFAKYRYYTARIQPFDRFVRAARDGRLPLSHGSTRTSAMSGSKAMMITRPWTCGAGNSSAPRLPGGGHGRPGPLAENAADHHLRRARRLL